MRVCISEQGRTDAMTPIGLEAPEASRKRGGQRAWIYCRTAGLDTMALDAQAGVLTAYANEHGFTVAGLTKGSENGLSMDRAGLNTVTDAVSRGLADVVLVMNMDRLGRETAVVDRYISWLGKNGAELVTVDGADTVFYGELRRKLLNLCRTKDSADQTPSA